jgi:AraC-like DNA-binding protein
MDWHRHDFLQLIHVLKGCLEADWGEGWQPLNAGDVHVLPPGVPHRLRAPAGHQQFGMNCTPQRDERGVLDALLRAFPLPTVLHVPFGQAWSATLCAPTWTPTGRIRVLSVLDDYALALLACRSAAHPSPKPLVELLKENLDKPLSVEDIAARLNTSRATLQRLAVKHFGCGVAHLHERLRLDRAAHQLLATDLRVGECAAACGYRDVYHFSRVFKRVIGQAPTVYRTARRQGLG